MEGKQISIKIQSNIFWKQISIKIQSNINFEVIIAKNLKVGLNK